MAETRTLDRLHDATHHVPGVPEHATMPSGHQGIPRHGRTVRRADSGHRSRNHAHTRPPRVLVAWQQRIAAFFSRKD